MCSAELYASVDTSNLQQETRTRQIYPTPSDARPYSEIKHHVHDGPVELFLIEEVTGADQSLHSVVIYDGNRYELKGEVDWLRSGKRTCLLVDGRSLYLRQQRKHTLAHQRWRNQVKAPACCLC